MNISQLKTPHEISPCRPPHLQHLVGVIGTALRHMAFQKVYDSTYITMIYFYVSLTTLTWLVYWCSPELEYVINSTGDVTNYAQLCIAGQVMSRTLHANSNICFNRAKSS